VAPPYPPTPLDRKSQLRPEWEFFRALLGLHRPFGLVKLSLTSQWSGRELSIPLVHPGQTSAKLPVFDGNPRSLDALAIGPTTLRMVECEQFLRFLLSYPTVAINLLRDFATGIRRDTEIMEESSFMDVPGRLARVILREATAQSDRSLATVPLSQTQLAELVGTTREALNLTLNGLKKLGLIEVKDQRVSVVNREALVARAT
jgi:CRP-like cAMP-binding protein